MRMVLRHGWPLSRMLISQSFQGGKYRRTTRLKAIGLVDAPIDQLCWGNCGVVCKAEVLSGLARVRHLISSQSFVNFGQIALRRSKLR